MRLVVQDGRKRVGESYASGAEYKQMGISDDKQIEDGTIEDDGSYPGRKRKRRLSVAEAQKRWKEQNLAHYQMANRNEDWVLEFEPAGSSEPPTILKPRKIRLKPR